MSSTGMIDRVELAVAVGVCHRTVRRFLREAERLQPHVIARQGSGHLPTLYSRDAVVELWRRRTCKAVGRKPFLATLKLEHRTAFVELSNRTSQTSALVSWLRRRGYQVCESTVRRHLKSGVPAIAGETIAEAAPARLTRQRRSEPGEGASNPRRGDEVSRALLERIQSPDCPSLTKGYGECAITLGLTAAERLLEAIDQRRDSNARKAVNR